MIFQLDPNVLTDGLPAFNFALNVFILGWLLRMDGRISRLEGYLKGLREGKEGRRT